MRNGERKMLKVRVCAFDPERIKGFVKELRKKDP